MTNADKMRAVIASATNKPNATTWLDRFRHIREAEGPQRIPSVRPSHETPKQK
jgi:hypothetical protein